MTFEQTINRFITSRNLLEKSGKYLVALSGGPDSVALLRTLKSLGYSIEAAHCNFHLRGAESDRDEAFCVDLCKQQAIPLHIVHFDTVTYAQLHKVSIEMAARNLRYHWFAQLCHDISANGICVAHHQDDQVETVLLNLLRGTGLKGLTGMKAKSNLSPTDSSDLSPSPSPSGRGDASPLHNGNNTPLSEGDGLGERSLQESSLLLRPFLCVDEEQILAYLKSLNQSYVIDSSNLKDDVQRNKLRLDIIPMLEKVTPAARRNILRMTENLQDIQTIVEASLKEAKVECSSSVTNASTLPSQKPIAFSLSKLHAYSSPKTLLWSILSPYGFNRTQMEEVATCKTDNKEWCSNSHIAIVSRGNLIIVDRKQWEQPLPTLHIPEPGLYGYNTSSADISASTPATHVRISRQQISPSFTISKEPNLINIDAEKVTFPLILRPIKDGDRFTPFGMHGSKLVSDYLKDRKRSVIDRHDQLVLTDKTDNILWLIGECIEDHYKLMKGKSREVLTIELSTDTVN